MINVIKVVICTRYEISSPTNFDSAASTAMWCDTAPTMTLRRDASPASPVDARLSRAPRLGLRPSMARRWDERSSPSERKHRRSEPAPSGSDKTASKHPKAPTDRTRPIDVSKPFTRPPCVGTPKTGSDLRGLSRHLRGGFVSRLRQQIQDGKLPRLKDPAQIKALLDTLMAADWVVYSKRCLLIPRRWWIT